MKISILVDDPRSWILPWASLLHEELERLGHEACLVASQDEIPQGDIAFFLGCSRIVEESNLAKNRLNLVVHPSDLPRGRGFSPLAWQILEGCSDIPICLFEAVPDVDAGDVYLRSVIALDGTELNEEIKYKQGKKTLEMCLRFLDSYPQIKASPQTGTPTYYKRRSARDSEIDVDMSLRALFPLLRVVDNNRYPAYFFINGAKYVLHIEKDDQST